MKIISHSEIRTIIDVKLFSYYCPFSKKALPLTSAKPQAATQAITPSLRPRPSYPLAAMIKRTPNGYSKY